MCILNLIKKKQPYNNHLYYSLNSQDIVRGIKLESNHWIRASQSASYETAALY